MRVLQRGRARAGAECWSGRMDLDLVVIASTGPRPRGRGMRDVAGSIGGVVYASTGPRPRGRGMGAAVVNSSAAAAPLQRGRARAGAE